MAWRPSRVSRSSGRRSTRSVLLSLAAAALLLAGSATATPVTYSFTGTVTAAVGTFSGQGNAVTGFYTVDDSLSVDFFPGDPFIDQFRSNQNPGLMWEISVTVGAVTVSSADNLNTLGGYHHHLGASDDVSGDEWRLAALRIDADDDSFGLVLRDFLPVPPDAIAVGSGNLDTAPILSPGDLSLYSDIEGLGSVTQYDNGGQQQGQVQFTLTSVTLVPEPGTALLLATGLGLLAVGRKRASARRQITPRR